MKPSNWGKNTVRKNRRRSSTECSTRSRTWTCPARRPRKADGALVFSSDARGGGPGAGRGALPVHRVRRASADGARRALRLAALGKVVAPAPQRALDRRGG